EHNLHDAPPPRFADALRSDPATGGALSCFPVGFREVTRPTSPPAEAEARRRRAPRVALAVGARPVDRRPVPIHASSPPGDWLRGGGAGGGPLPRPPPGAIGVTPGSMFSGKTEELTRRLKRALFARQRVQAFKPRIDDRYDASRIVSHQAVSVEAVAV